MARDPGLEASLWAATAAPAPQAPPLDGARRADVAIVGAGFTGCSAALHLAEKGVDVVLLEADEVGWGGSGRNAGYVQAGLWLHPDEVERRIGGERGRRFVETFDKVPELVCDIIERHDIDCDLVRRGVLKAAHSRMGLKWVEEYVRQWRARGAAVDALSADETAELLGTGRYIGGFVDHRSATIQPLSYARGLARAAQAKGAAIHCGTRVTEVTRDGQGWRLSTPTGSVTAESLILATNAYSDDYWPGLRRSTVPVTIFACATEPLGENVRGTVLPGGYALWDTQPSIYFVRTDRDHRLMIGSMGDLPATPPEDAKAWPNRALRWLFPQLEGTRWSHRWIGTVGFTPDHIPRLHEPAPGVHVAIGYNGRGIAQGTLWGKVMAERVMGMPASEVVLPLTPVRPVRFRTLWRLFYDTAFRAYRLRRVLD